MNTFFGFLLGALVRGIVVRLNDNQERVLKF